MVATLLWLVGSIAFSFYVANFGSYSSTYGSLAGGIVLLLWLWLTNVAVVFGAQFAAELERDRERGCAGAPAPDAGPDDPDQRRDDPHAPPSRADDLSDPRLCGDFRHEGRNRAVRASD